MLWRPKAFAGGSEVRLHEGREKRAKQLGVEEDLPEQGLQIEGLE